MTLTLVEPKQRNRVPEGQPKSYPRVRMVKGKKDDKELAVFVYPYQVVNVRSRSDLDDALAYYSHPFPMMDGAPVPKNIYARRYLIEWIFPALRWFCSVYGVKVPDWLKGNGWADNMSKESHKKFFGAAPLKVSEWKEDDRAAGERA